MEKTLGIEKSLWKQGNMEKATNTTSQVSSPGNDWKITNDEREKEKIK